MSTRSFTLLFAALRGWGVGVEFFRELMLPSDHRNPRGLDTGESQPVPADDSFQRRRYHIANAGVRVESGEDPCVHASFDCNSRTKHGKMRSGRGG